MSSYIDISWPLASHMPTYPGDPEVSVQAVATVAEHGYAVSALQLGSHSGTHVDAPAHFVHGGVTVEQLPLQLLCGETLVLDLRHAGTSIEADLLEQADLRTVERLLLRTHNETVPRHSPPHDLVNLAAAAADYLVQHTPVRLLGIDHLSIETGIAPDYPAHRTLLGAHRPVLLLEGLDLSRAPAGWYQLTCLPLALQGCDAAPARAVLRQLPEGERRG